MLDDLNNIKKFNTGRVAESIEALPSQVAQVLKDFKSINLSAAEYKNITEVVVNGMGGSNIGVGILKSVFSENLKVPISITPGYGVPTHVGQRTLYIFSSYSGSTEEPLSAYKEVKGRGAKMLAICSAGGSALEKLMKKDRIPGYVFEPLNNPCGQPRLGTAYSIFGIVMLLARAGLLKVSEKNIKEAVAGLSLLGKKFLPQSPVAKNPAKQIAIRLAGKQPILVGAEFLIGNVRALRNQFCENSKNFASYLTLPDLNHFAMEGLSNPASLKKDLAFLFFDSALYHPRVQKRSALTKKVVKQDGIEIVEYWMSGSDKLNQALELLQLGSWTTFYLAVLNRINPAEIRWVDWFKKQLK